MLKRSILLLTIVFAAAVSLVAQGTFKPRDADETHAWRLHNEYRQSRKNEDQLKGAIAIKGGDIRTMSVGSIPIYIDPQDVSEIAKLRRQLQAEMIRQNDLKTAWDKKFYGRYGHLQDSDETIVDPVTKKTMDKIEFRLINFPFNDASKPVTEPANAAGGSWHKVREKLWNYYTTPNEPDENHQQSGAPYDLSYTNNYYDRNGTRRWLKDFSRVTCKLDLLNADRVAPGQKVNVSCSMSYKAERHTGGGSAAFWVGDLPIQTPGGFKPDGTIYPFWGNRTDPVLRIDAPNNGTGVATGQFSFPAKPGQDNEPFCIRLSSGIAGVAAVEVCYEWQAGPTGGAAAGTGENLARGRPSSQSSRSQWSKPNDAQGAVDGVKNGSFGFHTSSEPNPWWQVDLGAAKQINEVRIFNRLDYNPERARTIQVFVSNDGKNWTRVFANNGNIFGGSDGHPLRVLLKGTTARFVRLQLAETNYFHLDEVEIY